MLFDTKWNHYFEIVAKIPFTGKIKDEKNENHI